MSDAAATSGGHGHGHDPEAHLQHHFDTPEQQLESGKLGMWLFLAQELLFFGGLFCAYAIFRASQPDMFVFGSSLLSWKMGAFNTVVLICSSLTMAWAVRCAQVGQRKLLMWMLIATQVFAGVFLVVKYFEYGEKIEHGLLWGTHYEPSAHTLAEKGWVLPGDVEDHGTGSPVDANGSPGAQDAEGGHDAEQDHGGEDAHGEAAGHGEGDHGGLLAVAPANGHIFFGIYFIMTGLHLLHVLAGMAAIGWLMFGAARGIYGPKFFNPVDIVGLYWHLVDLVWIFLFPLLYLI